MSINYIPTADGLFVQLVGHLGSIEATIHRPDHLNKEKKWRLCFATCIGEAYPLIGKVLERNTLGAIKHDLQRYDREMNASYGKAIPGFRGMPLA